MFKEIKENLMQGKEGTLCICDEKANVTFKRVFRPQERLIILGAGHVSRWVCSFASQVGFCVTIVDDRAQYATKERFPLAKQHLVGDYEKMISKCKITPYDYVAVMTRGHLMDDVCMRTILGGVMPGYLGMIGSKRRIEGMFLMYLEEGMDEKAIKSIHSPIGLPIHAVTPEEIAISVVAELIEERSKRNQMDLEDKETLAQTNADMELIQYLANESEKCAVAIVLSATGSTPVKSGSMMSVNEKGKILGTVGGGVGEYQVMEEAKALLKKGGTKVMTFDMSNEVASKSEMVCGGQMEVYLFCVNE